MEENANSNEESGNVSGIINIEDAFGEYLKSQAETPEETEGKEHPEPEAKDGQSENEDKQKPEETEGKVEQLFKVKVNGEEKEIPLEELVKGYQLESDYRIKTSKLAEESRATQEKAQQAQALQNHYSQQLQAYSQQLQSMQPQPPNPETINTDPVGYLRQQQAYQAWQAQIQQVQHEKGQLAEYQKHQQAESMQEMVKQQRELLLTAIPEWKDKEVFKTSKEDMNKYLQGLGYSPGEISQAVDHRAIVLAHKAMKYDAMVANQKNATEKVAKLPPKAPQRPGSGQNTTSSDGVMKSKQALRKSGSIDDAAAAFASMMGG